MYTQDEAIPVFDHDWKSLGAVINYDYTLLLARVSAPSLMSWNGHETADTKGFGA
ncbi:MAG: hypothetical protein ACAF41_32860 [Leptolyngbya sp. BL-A-14]